MPRNARRSITAKPWPAFFAEFFHELGYRRRASPDRTGRDRLRRHPECVGLVEADVSAGIPGVIAFPGDVADLRSDHDRLTSAVDGADGKYPLSVGLQELLPCTAPTCLVGRVFPLLDVIEKVAGFGHVAPLALP